MTAKNDVLIEALEDRKKYNDVITMLERYFYHIIKVDLLEDTFVPIKGIQGASEMEAYSRFSSFVHDYLKKGWVHPDDTKEFAYCVSAEYISDWVKRDKSGELIIYRRAVEDDYEWTSLEVLKSSDYSPEHPVVLMFIRNIHESYSVHVAQRKQIEQFVRMDQMTAMLNRVAYTQTCADYLSYVEKYSIGVIFADINGLKYVNDHYGHKNGDEYILTFANTLLNLYGTDMCYRISGDEFLVVFEHFNKDHFVAEFNKLKVFLDAQPSPMASVGAFWSEAPHNLEDVTREAEKSMYMDKQFYYEKFHHLTREKMGNYEALEFDIEQILAAQVHGENFESEGELDTSGLSSRLFDVFASTTKRSYLFLTNLTTNVSRWSKLAVEDFDLPGEYMTGFDEMWLERIHPDDRKRYQESIDDVFHGDAEMHDLTYRVLNPKGQYVTVACEGCIIKGQGDEPDYFSGTITNFGIPDEVDRITNLPSKSAFMQHLKSMTLEEKNSGVMMVVIDLFSSINALYGWECGEDILRKFGENLLKIVGDAGMVYHIESATFCICFDEACEEDVRNCYGAIQEMGYQGIENDGLKVTLKTLGSATIFGNAKDEDERINSNLGHIIGVSKMMYHSDLVFFDVLGHTKEMDNRDVLGAIYQDSLGDCSGFRLFYQPIVDAHDGRILGAEALVRWEKEPYGLVFPDRFIPFMEHNPCIYELGNWVIRQAIMDGKQMCEKIPDFIVNVNVSPTQLERKEFRNYVIQVLQEFDYGPEHLCIELTERCRELDFDFLREQITFFREQGIRIAMDDFGTGNASLQLVLELPLDEVKIDRSFVQDIQHQQINQVLVSGIVSGAKTIDADICIEGIENEELGDYLQQYEPTYYQGYYYSRPVPKTEFMELLERQQAMD